MTYRYTFSIKQGTEAEKNNIKKLKEECANKGISFSFVVVKALNEYIKRKNDRKR